MRIGGEIQPSIATLLAEKNGLGDRSFQPDWSIDARKIQRFSFVDVMTGRIPVGKLRGKRILIGATATIQWLSICRPPLRRDFRCGGPGDSYGFAAAELRNS